MSGFALSLQSILVIAEIATVGALLVLARRAWRRRSDVSFADAIAALESAIDRARTAPRSRRRQASVVRLDEYRARRALGARSGSNVVAARPRRFDGTSRSRRAARSGGSADHHR